MPVAFKEIVILFANQNVNIYMIVCKVSPCPLTPVLHTALVRVGGKPNLAKAPAEGIQSMNKIKLIKWTSTIAVLTGIALTNLNAYPVNIMIHGAGAVGWTVAGFLAKDRALLTNFCLQLPFFVFGIINYYLGWHG